MTEDTTKKFVKRTRLEKIPSKVDDVFSVEAKRKDWTYRRILIFGTCVICFGWITWAAGWMRVETANSLMSSAFALLMVLIPSYVGAAVTDDYLRNRTKAQYGGGGWDRETEESVESDNRPRWGHRSGHDEEPPATDPFPSQQGASRSSGDTETDPDLPASRGR